MSQQTPDFGEIKVVRSGSVNTSRPTVVTGVAEPVRSVITPEALAPKKPWFARFWWLPLLLVAGIAATVWGRNYYENRYVGSDYWAQVPATQDTTLVESISDSGQPTGMYGVHYFVTAFNEAGEQRQLDFVYHADNETSVPQPGDYLWISASRQLVVRQRVVPESEVPASVRDLIAGDHN